MHLTHHHHRVRFIGNIVVLGNFNEVSLHQNLGRCLHTQLVHQLKHKGAETLIKNSAEWQGSVTARVTCCGEHSTVFRSPFHPAQHCNGRGFWQPQGRVLSALLLYTHRQDSLVPPDRDINTIFLYLEASQSPQLSHPTPQSATNISHQPHEQGAEIHSRLSVLPALAILPVHYPVINCSNLVCAAQLPILLAVFGAQLVSNLQQEKNSVIIYILAFPPPHIPHYLQFPQPSPPPFAQISATKCTQLSSLSHSQGSRIPCTSETWYEVPICRAPKNVLCLSDRVQC